jgi:hypothetical protein
MGMARVLPPLPVTCSRRAPEVPSSEPMLEATASPSRIPVTQNVATRARSRSGQGPRPRGSGPAAVASSRAAASGSRMARGAPSTRRGLGTAAMGLPSTRSSATRKSKNREHDEWAHRIVARPHGDVGQGDATERSSHPDQSPRDGKDHRRHPRTTATSPSESPAARDDDGRGRQLGYSDRHPHGAGV